MLDVFHQRIDIRVAIDGVLAQAGRDDRVQVACQPPCGNRRIRGCGGRAHRRRFVMHDLLHDAADRKALAAPWTSSAQQLEQQDPERIDVGGDGDGPSGQLFGGCIVGRERGHRCVDDSLPARIEPLGDAEVEQLHAPFGGDQDVSRLQVAVDDQVAMRVVDRLANLQEERQPIVQAGMPALAVLDDGFAAHVLDNGPQPAIGSGAAVQQARDAGMVQGRERLPLGMKARDVRRRVAVQQLQGDGQVEHAIGTRSRIDFSGAAPPDQWADQPGTDSGAGHELRRWCCSTRRTPSRLGSPAGRHRRRARRAASAAPRATRHRHRTLGGRTRRADPGRIRRLRQKAVPASANGKHARCSCVSIDEKEAHSHTPWTKLAARLRCVPMRATRRRCRRRCARRSALRTAACARGPQSR